MSLVLRIGLTLGSIVLLCVVVRLVLRGKLQLKYSLLWMFLSLMVLVAALFPNLVSMVSGLLGIGVTSNFVFLAGFIFMFGICLSLSVIVSWQARDIRSLVQQVALLRKELDDRGRE